LAERPKLTTADDSLVKWSGLALNDLAKDAIIRRAEADEKIAESTVATPARQESVRAFMFIAAILGVAFGGHALHFSDWLIGGIATALTAMYGIPKAIEKLGAAKALSLPK
jgi:hypothetical protein